MKWELAASLSICDRSTIKVVDRTWMGSLNLQIVNVFSWYKVPDLPRSWVISIEIFDKNLIFHINSTPPPQKKGGKKREEEKTTCSCWCHSPLTNIFWQCSSLVPLTSSLVGKRKILTRTFSVARNTFYWRKPWTNMRSHGTGGDTSRTWKLTNPPRIPDETQKKVQGSQLNQTGCNDQRKSWKLISFKTNINPHQLQHHLKLQNVTLHISHIQHEKTMKVSTHPTAHKTNKTSNPESKIQRPEEKGKRNKIINTRTYCMWRCQSAQEVPWYPTGEKRKITI